MWAVWVATASLGEFSVARRCGRPLRFCNPALSGTVSNEAERNCQLPPNTSRNGGMDASLMGFALCRRAGPRSDFRPGEVVGPRGEAIAR
jgi:hypothetical protein